MQFSKSVVLLFLTFLAITLFSTTIEVNQDGSADFTEIQTAINNSTNGDTVLVYPGTYYENVDMNNKNITLCSLEATTGDSTYIESTIINGNQSGSCIKVMNGETVTIQGFSLTNGSGTYYNYKTQGGGIIAIDYSTLNLISCNVYENYAPYGGGVYLRYSDAFLSNVNIYDNKALYLAGGIYLFAWHSDYPHIYAEFDSTDRCSVYNNHASSFQDIYMYNFYFPMELMLDKVSFENPDEYYIGSSDYDVPFCLDYQRYDNEYIDNDLYVAPWGSDENSGLSPEDPLQNINYATYYLKPDSLNPHTINMLSGIYSPNNQEFYISLKSNMILKGESRETTIIDGLNEPDKSIMISKKSENTSIKNISLVNMTYASIQGAHYTKDQCIENVYISNGTGMGGGITFAIGGTIWIKDVVIENCNSVHSASIYIINAENVYVDNLVSRNNTNISSTINGVNLVCYRNDCEIKNSTFTNNKNLFFDEYFNSAGNSTLSVGNSVNIDFVNSWIIENCLFYDNIALQNYNCGSGFTITATSATNKGYFINNTVINNTGMRTMFLGGLDTYVMNNIFYNNNSLPGNNDGYELCVPNTFQSMFHSNITFSNNIIKNGYDGYHDDYPSFNEETWINDPIDLDPLLYANDEQYPYFPLDNSPVIDAGTTDFPEGYEMPEFDLAGNPRIAGDAIDIGCYEWVDGLVSIDDEEININNSEFKINNYPNPFNPTTTISYSIPNDSNVSLNIYNVKGQKVKTLVNEPVSKGKHDLVWNGINDQGDKVSSGIYFYKLNVNGKTKSSKKCLLLK